VQERERNGARTRLGGFGETPPQAPALRRASSLASGDPRPELIEAVRKAPKPPVPFLAVLIVLLPKSCRCGLKQTARVGQFGRVMQSLVIVQWLFRGHSLTVRAYAAIRVAPRRA